jgi:diaminohydroxyphosphoribosylaminopyrimidine deaminase/5-amino-6-(5-phosphoribosylamino)uracil reductase
VKDGTVVGKGHHAKAGLPHAEPMALDDAGEAAKGADLYVTLEPCCHHGRTPPCTERIIAAGIRRVYYSTSDVTGDGIGGHAVLEQAGIETEAGLLDDEAAEIYVPFNWHRRHSTPYGILKMAMTLDGKIGPAEPGQHWLTGDESREYVHRLRNECDAVMVGSVTARVDDPQLNCRLPDGRDPVRVVVASKCDVASRARAIKSDSDAPCVVATTELAPMQLRTELENAGAEVLVLPSDEGRVDLASLWKALGQRGLLSVLIEGGPTLAASALEAGIVNKLALLYAPRIIGDVAARSAFGGPTGLSAEDVEVRSIEMLGPDILVEAYPCSRD